ncbi:MAG: hypothetical protein NVV63_18490 [Opitutus sp.]|nr:hypothetical protein [Opitutus sp.]
MLTKTERFLLTSNKELTRIAGDALSDVAAIYLYLSTLPHLDAATQEELRKHSEQRKELGQQMRKNAETLGTVLEQP